MTLLYMANLLSFTVNGITVYDNTVYDNTVYDITIYERRSSDLSLSLPLFLSLSLCLSRSCSVFPSLRLLTHPVDTHIRARTHSCVRSGEQQENAGGGEWVVGGTQGSFYEKAQQKPARRSIRTDALDTQLPSFTADTIPSK